jgi:charged multivesicular body protein 7
MPSLSFTPQLLDAYKLGAQTLATVLQSQNLTVERVEETMDAVSDALADQKDIEEAITGGVDVSDEDELERELEKLMISGQTRIAETDVMEGAPSVPAGGLEVEEEPAEKERAPLEKEKEARLVEEAMPAT